MHRTPTRPGAMAAPPTGNRLGGDNRSSVGIPVPRTVISSGPSSTTTSGADSSATVVQEFSLRVPKGKVAPISIMRFNKALGVDPSKWKSVKMIREDNSKYHKTHVIPTDDDQPKFGAGSEYRREAREEARKRKYGLHKKKYNPNDQPWILKVADKISKKYKGVREGGISENASYYIFTQAPDGAFECFPVEEWYNFTPIQRFKSLTAEEAEEEFGRRNKIMNYFQFMVQKRMKNDGDIEDDSEMAEAKKGRGKKASSGLKLSEMDDWADSDDEFSDDEEGEAESSGPKKAGKKKPKKKKLSDDEGKEDSDDGDEEGRELDYISDTSESESEEEKEKKANIQGVDQEEALKRLLDSGSESENENTTNREEVEEEDDEEKSNTKTEDDSSDKKKKKPKKKSDEKDNIINISDDDDINDPDSVDVLSDSSSAKIENVISSPDTRKDDDIEIVDFIGSKRKASTAAALAGPPTKKSRIDVSPSLIQLAASEGIHEEAVRRYLLRKPMTVTELLHKFKSKKTKISSQDMVNVTAHILKKINPVKRMQNQKMYLYLTAPKN